MSESNKGTTVRFPDALKRRLERVSSASGFRPSDLIRRAVESYCDEVERVGFITVPMTLQDEPTEYAVGSKPVETVKKKLEHGKGKATQ